MRHLKKGRKLGRTKSHRLATLKALAMALIEHEAITTTIPKAREASRYVDRLITTARGGNLAARRLVASRLGNEAMAKKLFEDVAPRYATRPGGYTRVIKLAKFRIGDASQLARLELVEKREKPKAEKKEGKK
ncbi:MAG: 50S ribosomal protein L17 [Planctomycetota bacterium]|nr:50S ribosomal protein L17 [Planctomycetota bacterium]